MAKFDPKQSLKLITKNTEYFVIGFLALLVIIMLVFLTRNPNIDIPVPTPIDVSKIPFPTEASKEVEIALNGLVPFEQSNYQKELLQRNLFSFRDVLSKQAIEKEITDKLKRAQTLFDQGSYREVIDLTDEILRVDENREPARILKEKAQKALQSTDTTVVSS